MIGIGKAKTVWIALVGAAVLLVPSSAAALSGILGVRHWVAPDHTRIVLDVSRETGFKLVRQGERLFVDLAGTAFPTHLPGEIPVRKPHLEAILLSPGAEDGVRLTLCLPATAQTNVFALKPYQDKPHRIVIDIVVPEAAQQQSEARLKVRMMRKDRIVVIDPGHGGESVGAVGRGGLLEKDVVLAIARRLRDILNRQEGYRAFLTRDGDYYVSFSQRLAIAREYGADIFLSIHADAARNRSAAGASVYSLSLGGASSEAAKILAREENLADFLGGVPNGDNSDASDPIILDMFQTSTINQSRTLGDVVLKHLAGTNRLKFPSVQEAPFRVLKLPQIPSVLIETAFISNPREEKLLKSSGFQQKIVEAVAASVREFIPPLPAVAQLVQEGGGRETPAETTTVTGERAVAGEAVRVIETVSAPSVHKASLREGNIPPPQAARPDPAAGGSPASYRVQKGDTLGGIAQREGTTIAVLLRLNRMKLDDPLHVGRSLTLPAAVPEVGVKGTPASPPKRPDPVAEAPAYRVRKGDSLGGIAQREGTTIAVLLRLNGMKLDDPLYVGRSLTLPAAVPEGGVKATPPSPPKRPDPVAEAPVYRVRKGDSLGGIAQREGTSIAVLLRLNGMKLDDPLHVGRLLTLPAGTEANIRSSAAVSGKDAKSEPASTGNERRRYRVQKGDSLTKVASRQGTTTTVLAELNGMKETDRLVAGRILRLPAGSNP